MLRQGLAFLGGALVAAWLLGAASAADDPRQEQLRGWDATLNPIAAALKREDISADELKSVRAAAMQVAYEANALRQSLKPELATAEAQVKALAPAKDDTAAELDVVKEARAKQQAVLDAILAIDQQANVLGLRAGELASAADQLLEQRFTELLLSHGPSIASPSLWSQVAGETAGMAVSLGKIGGGLAERISGHSDLPVPLLLALALIILLVAYLGARLLAGAVRRQTAGEAPSPERKILTASTLLVIEAATPILALFVLQTLLDFDRGATGYRFADLRRPLSVDRDPGADRGAGAEPLRAAPPGLADRGGFGSDRAARRRPDEPRSAVCVAPLPLIDQLAEITATPEPFALPIKTALAVLAAGAILLTARVLIRDAAGDGKGGTAHKPPVWTWLLPPTAFVALVIAIAALGGYLILAVFLAKQVVWVWMVFGVAVLTLGLANIAVAGLFSSNRPVGRAITRNLAASPNVMDQLAVVVGGLVSLLIVVFAALAALAAWEVDLPGLLSGVRRVVSGFRIGSITISFTGIVAGLIVFVAVIVAGRVLQSWLRNRFLPTTRIDPGLKNSILTGVSYAAIILAVLFSASYAGLDLAKIAIVAGALSVGIGFGLQSIVNNFVSGLILLAERPIRAGDWIAVGGEQGTVKRISVRATEIETFDRASVIVPNSNLISGVVKNMYLRDNSGRIEVTIGVGYNSDPEEVRSILLACAAEQNLILGDPAPLVLFTDFGDSALTFELSCFIADISKGAIVRSDLRFAILARLRQAAIEIPFPQHDVNLRDLPRFEEMLAGLAGGRAPRRNKEE